MGGAMRGKIPNTRGRYPSAFMYDVWYAREGDELVRYIGSGYHGNGYDEKREVIEFSEEVPIADLRTLLAIWPECPLFWDATAKVTGE